MRETIERSPFTVDCHFVCLRNAKMLELVYARHLLHVRSITTGAKDNTNARGGIDVMRCDERSNSIVDNTLENYWDLMPLESLLEQTTAVNSLCSSDTKPFGPADKYGVVDAILVARVRKRETKWKDRARRNQLVVSRVVGDEL